MIYVFYIKVNIKVILENLLVTAILFILLTELKSLYNCLFKLSTI